MNGPEGTHLRAADGVETLAGTVPACRPCASLGGGRRPRIPAARGRLQMVDEFPQGCVSTGSMKGQDGAAARLPQRLVGCYTAMTSLSRFTLALPEQLTLLCHRDVLAHRAARLDVLLLLLYGWTEAVDRMCCV